MPGGVAGAQSTMTAPYADYLGAEFCGGSLQVSGCWVQFSVIRRRRKVDEVTG